MTRQEIIDLMPTPPGLDWSKVEIGHTILHVPRSKSEPWWFGVVQLTRLEEEYFFGREIWVDSDGDRRYQGDAPFGADYDDTEVGWNLTLLSREHKLPPEIVQLAVEMLYDQR